jgi:hypothetical protein
MPVTEAATLAISVRARVWIRAGNCRSRAEGHGRDQDQHPSLTHVHRTHLQTPFTGAAEEAAAQRAAAEEAAATQRAAAAEAAAQRAAAAEAAAQRAAAAEAAAQRAAAAEAAAQRAAAEAAAAAAD